MSQAPTINRITPLSAEEAKWTELRKIEWTDQTGRNRVWEAAARKTRSKGGIDAVAIAPIIRHPSHPPSTLIILQYRPPVEAICVEFPAGLIDEGETPEEAAVRELKEETGYEGKVCHCSVPLSNQPGMSNAKLQVLDCSPTIVSDPGLTTANMQVRSFTSRLANDGLWGLLTGDRWSPLRWISKKATRSPNNISRRASISSEGSCHWLTCMTLYMVSCSDVRQERIFVELLVTPNSIVERGGQDRGCQVSNAMCMPSTSSRRLIQARLYHWALGLYWSKRVFNQS